MPAFAPRAAVQGEMVRGEAARQVHQAGTVTLGGILYNGAVELKPLRHVQNDNGLWERKQTLRVVILKSLLAAAPAKRAEILHQGITFTVDGDISGFSGNEPAWIITASRKLPAP